MIVTILCPCGGVTMVAGSEQKTVRCRIRATFQTTEVPLHYRVLSAFDKLGHSCHDTHALLLFTGGGSRELPALATFTELFDSLDVYEASSPDDDFEDDSW